MQELSSVKKSQLTVSCREPFWLGDRGDVGVCRDFDGLPSDSYSYSDIFTPWLNNQLNRSYGGEDSLEKQIPCTFSTPILKRYSKCSFYRMHAFNQSLRYDQRMHAADIRGSIAYAKSLTLVGILTKDEERRIIEGLKIVGKEWEDGQVLAILYYFRCALLTFFKVQSPGRRRGHTYCERTSLERVDRASGRQAPYRTIAK
jgi:hypothetical protein